MVYCQSWKEIRGAQTVGHKLTKPYVPSLSHAVCPAMLHMSTQTGTGMYSWFSCWGLCRSYTALPLLSASGWPPCSSLGLEFGVSSHLTDTPDCRGWQVDSQDCAHRFILLVPLASQRSRDNSGIWELRLTISTVSPRWFFSFYLDKF